jgi:hypothetical protein
MGRRLLPLSLLLLAGCASQQTTVQTAPETEEAEAGQARQQEGQAAEAAVPPRPLTPSQRAAQKVVKLEVRPAELTLRVNETAELEIVALDEAGAEVQGVRPRTFVRGRVGTVRNTTLTATEPGEGTVWVGVQKPHEDGEIEWVTATLALTVEPLPVVRVEIQVPQDMAPYVGTRVPLEARAYSEARYREDAVIEWSSSNSRVARVSSAGVVQAHSAGTVTVTATSEGISESVELEIIPNPVRNLTVGPEDVELEVGNVTHFSATASDSRNRTVPLAPIEWTAAGISGQPRGTAHIEQDGSFVADMAGLYRVTATVGDLSASTEVRATPRAPRRPVRLVAHGVVNEDHNTSDLWIFEGVDGRDYAYTGTHAGGVGGHVMFAWDVTDASNPVVTDSVVVDARVVNDVKINEDATLAVITREGASNRRNGIVILDIDDPAHPVVLSEFTQGLTAGIHNTWIEGQYVYAINDGTRDVHIIDISDPANPVAAGRWGLDKEDKYVHDVMVKDGLAYLSYWNDGLVILDVGAGIKGGTPTEPQFVSQFKSRAKVGAEEFGNTHHAIRYGNYVFLGDEIFGCQECVNGPRGYVHVVDVTDIENPHEVARYEVPEAGTHNLWAEDDRLYVAYYNGGLRVVDISGELRGDLYRQGREIGWYMTEDDEGITPRNTMTWGPQPYKGLVYATDMNSGLWIVEVEEEEQQLVP